MRVAVYTRVSTEEQAQEGFSIAAQKEKLLAFIHSQDWQLYDSYIDEGVSAKNLERPQLKRLLGDVRARKVDVVLVYKLDRLTRSVLDLYHLLQEFDQYEVKFKSATEVYDTTTAIGRLFITLVAALAQWERENLAERVKFGQEQMVHERKRPGGRAPFGFDLQDGTLVINEREAHDVRWIFRKYVNGAGLETIAHELNQMGVITKFGGEWSKTSVQLLLRNQAYYGALRWNYTKGGSKINAPDDWILIDDVYEPIIEKETFDAAEQIAKTRKQRHPRELASDFIFSGVLRCTRCGELLYGKTARSKPRDTEYVMRHYICKNVKAKKCNAPLIREEQLEQVFVQMLQQAVGAGDDVARKVWQKQKKPVHDETQVVKKQLVKLTERRKRWQLAFADGMIERDELRERLAEDEAQEKALREQLAMAQEAAPAGQAGVVLTDEKIVAMLVDVPLVWAYATVLEKKHLVSLLVKSIVAGIDEAERKKWAKNKQIVVEEIRFK